MRVQLCRVRLSLFLFRFVLVTRGDVWKCDVVVLHYTEDAVMNINALVWRYLVLPRTVLVPVGIVQCRGDRIG